MGVWWDSWAASCLDHHRPTSFLVSSMPGNELSGAVGYLTIDLDLSTYNHVQQGYVSKENCPRRQRSRPKVIEFVHGASCRTLEDNVAFRMHLAESSRNIYILPLTPAAAQSRCRAPMLAALASAVSLRPHVGETAAQRPNPGS